MSKIVKVLLVEDDPYARSWMELLLRRDWRTSVADEVDSPSKLLETLKKAKEDKVNIDLILVDTDIPGDEFWLPDVWKILNQHLASTSILCTGVWPNERVAALLSRPNFAGYVLKDEIRYGLARAAAMTDDYATVITPGVQDLLFRASKQLPPKTIVLDGRHTITNLTEHQADMARLVILFSMERRELADEMNYNKDYPYGLASEIYKKIGLNELLAGEVDPSHYLGNHPAVLSHFNEILRDRKLSKKHKDKETLAFHLLTMPEIVEIT